MRSRSRFKGATALAFAIGGSAFAAEEVSVTNVPVRVSHLQLGMTSSVRASQGSFDAYGNYVPFPPGSSSLNLMTSLSGNYRFNERWEGGVSLPIRLSQLRFPTGTMNGASMNCPSFDVRYHFGGWAHVVTHLGVSLPWSWKSRQVDGYPMANMPDDLGDAPQGTSVRLGAGVGRSFNRFRLAFDVSTTWSPSSDVPMDPSNPASATLNVRKPLRFTTSEGVAYALARQWSVHGGLRQSWAGDSVVNGVDSTGTAARAFSTSLGFGYAPSPSLHYTASYDSQFPFYSYAANQAYSPSVAVGVNYAPSLD